MGAILVVEPDNKFRNDIDNDLRTLGYFPITCVSGHKARTIMQDNPDIDAIVASINLGDMDGFEFAAWLKSKYPERYMPFILTASTKDMNYTPKVDYTHIDDFIFKPIAKDTLEFKMRTLMRMSFYYRQVQAQKIEIEKASTSKGALVQMIVHDMNNILTPLITFSDYLSEKLEGYHEEISQIRSSAYMLRSMAENMLDINRMENSTMALHKRLMNVKDILGHISPTIKLLEESYIMPIEIEAKQQLDVLNIDIELVTRVLLNLIINGIKRAPYSNYLAVKVNAIDKDMVFSIIDYGGMITKEKRDAMFDIYNKDNTLGTGYGLGLAFCKMAVESHGGRIWVADTKSIEECNISFSLPIFRKN